MKPILTILGEIMSPVIRISDNLYQRLEAYASGFDTPANVIETILNKYEGVPSSPQSSSNLEQNRDIQKEKEKEKVKNKLELWAKPKRQENINARILNVFLKLKQSGNECVTEKDIQKQLPDISTFESNFNQMKTIAERNHGKIFEETNGYIEIWEHVRLFVSKYEQEIFKQ